MKDIMIAYLCDRTLVKVVANILFVNLVKHLESINPERLVYWLKKYRLCSTFAFTLCCQASCTLLVVAKTNDI